MAAVVQEQYTWKPTVIDLFDSAVEAGVKVVVWDNDGGSPVTNLTTDAQGTIAQQTLINAIYDNNGSPDNWANPNLETPHQIRFLEYGFRVSQIQSSIAQATTPTFYIARNDFLTETNKSTANGYTLGISHGGETLTVSVAREITEIYDKMQVEAVDTPQYDYAEVVSTADGASYRSEYDIVVNTGITLDGESKSLSFGTGKDLTFSGTGKADNLTVNGDVNTASAVTLTGLNVTGTLDFTVAGSYTLDGCTINEVTNSSGGAVTISPINGSSINTNTGPNITILAGQATLTLTNLVANSEVRIYTAGTQTELDGVELSGTSFGYTYTYVPSTFVDIVVHKEDYKYVRIEDYELGSGDAGLPIQQIFDRNYSNPA